MNPIDLGAPEKYHSLRPVQSEYLDRALSSSRRFICLCLPTGSGKSLLNMMLALLAKRSRVGILTSTKGLEDQYSRDFPSLVDLRGRVNYPCILAENCEDGIDEGCGTPASPCSGFKPALRSAHSASIALSNYACYFHNGLGTPQLLICDEAHEVPEQIANFMAVELTRWELCVFLHRQPPEDPTSIPQWRRLAHDLLEHVNENLRDSEVSKKTKRILRRIKKKLDAITNAGDHWIAEETKIGWMIQPVWAAPYAEGILFQKTPRVILSSATVRPKTLKLLGLSEYDFDFFDAPSPFPLEQRPIRVVPTVSVDFRATPTHYRLWVNRADEIIDAWGGSKGIFHTTSYFLQRLFMDHTRHKERCITHQDATGIRLAVEEHRNRRGATVLVSPSVTTGYDFPGDECRFQILGKLPVPDSRTGIMAVRCREDKEYKAYVTMTRVVQTTGRGSRFLGDDCTTYIIDDHFKRFIYRDGVAEFAPLYWRESLEFDARVT